jgi:hypothetical protein
VVRRLPAFVGAVLVIGGWLGAPPAWAHSSWGVDDPCAVDPYANPYFYIFDDASPESPRFFVLVTTSGAGNGCHLYTTTQASPTLERGVEWYLRRSSSYDGRYYINTFIPCDAHYLSYKTTGARYKVFPSGHAGSFTTFVKDQRNYSPCNSYMYLTTSMQLYGSRGALVRLGNYTGVDNNSLDFDRTYFGALH